MHARACRRPPDSAARAGFPTPGTRHGRCHYPWLFDIGSIRGGGNVSKFDLRDISERLSASKNTEAVLFEFLGYLQAVRGDWRASLAFYEVSRDALVNVYQRQGSRLMRKDLSLPVDQLPARLVRKFFHPSAFFNHTDRKSLLAHLFQTSPYYEVNPLEAPELRAISPLATWTSAVCLPIADQEDVIAMLMIVSEKKAAFTGKVMADLLPVKAVTTLALSQHLHRARKDAIPEDWSLPAATQDFNAKVKALDKRAQELEKENLDKAQRVDQLVAEISKLDKSSSLYKQELDRVKLALGALEEQTVAATEQLNDAYVQLNLAQGHLDALQQTMGFLREVCQVLAQEHDPDTFSRTMVAWFCEHFGVERCSLMKLEPGHETLQIAAHRGIDPHVARQVKVRVGQGIAGWVAHNRRPLYVRVKNDGQPEMHTGQDVYNSDSFISVPLVHNNRLFGVLNLSNKKNGEAFEDVDFDRAVIAGSLLAITLGHQEDQKRVAVWS
jgi:transcriptional regulator with GAF, ATPase, and Fis domain